MTLANTPPLELSKTEIRERYPPGLRLDSVQVFFRHGERTPTAARFQNVGLPALWPFCASLRFRDHLSGPIPRNGASLESQPHGSASKSPLFPRLCALGELTDRGRETTFALGKYLRHLYVHQLGFLPERLHDPKDLFLRSTKFQRTFVSLQQVVDGLYPAETRDISSEQLPVTIVSPQDETLIPNEEWCPRFITLLEEFSRKAAMKWNGSAELEHVNKVLGKWMPNGQSVAVDSEPKLAGIFDTVSSALATPEPNKLLPAEFFDTKAREIMEKIVSEEEFGGYVDDHEFRMLGVGQPLNEIIQRMMQRTCRARESPRFTLLACHDSTIAGMLASLGVMEKSSLFWPTYGAFLTFELFHRPQETSAMNEAPMENRFVRVSFMGRPVAVPRCQRTGKHLAGDGTFCTMSAFKEVVDEITPVDWKKQCLTSSRNSSPRKAPKSTDI